MRRCQHCLGPIMRINKLARYCSGTCRRQHHYVEKLWRKAKERRAA